VRWKRLLIIAVVVIVVLIVTGYTILLNYDFNEFKPRIAQAVKEATGRTLILDGDIEIDFGFPPRIVAESLSFGNAPWGSRPELASVKRLEVQIALLPLIRGIIDFKQVILVEPDFLLETNNSGQSNLDFETADEEASTIQFLIFDEVRIDKGLFTYKDGQSGKTYVVKINRLTGAAPDYLESIELELDCAFKDKRFEIKGTFGGVEALIDANKSWPVQLSAGHEGATLEVEGSDLKVVLGENDLKGSVDLSFAGKRPQVIATLSSQKIDLRPLLVKAEKKGAVKGPQATSGKKKDKVFPSKPWPLDRLNLIDADIRIRPKQVLLPRLALDDITVDILLKNGNLTVEPIKFMIGGGSANGRFNLRSQDKPSALTMALKMDQLDLGQMLDELGYKRTLEGTLDAVITLAGSGNSLANLMAGLNGRISVVMKDGQVASKHLYVLQNILGTDVLRLINPFKKEETQTKVNCFINDIKIKDGLAECNLLLDTDQTSIFGVGDVDLRTEKLNLGIKPVPKKGYGLANVGTVGFSLKELSQPFLLSGTLAHPSLALDPTQAVFSLGKMAGALALGPIGIAAFFADVSLGKKDPCLEALNLLEKEEKDKEPGDFFRNLLRRKY
jgi:uncharacterized protein involved in outer membrane biogenesis